MSKSKRGSSNEPARDPGGNWFALGLDLGSVSLNSVVLSPEGEILEERYTRTRGQPMETALAVLQDVLKRYPADKIKVAGMTGSGGKLLSEVIGGSFINEIISQAKSMEKFHPDVKTVVEIGGEDSKLILLKRDEELGVSVIRDFAMNTICAAGTGSFLDQQASRLNVSIEEFG